MAEDYTKSVKHAVRALLRTSDPMLGLIPYASIYGSTVPANKTFPFFRIGSVVASPFRATGLSSSSFRMGLQAFTKDFKKPSGAVVEVAEDRAATIGAMIAEILDGATIKVRGGMHARIVWIQTIAMRDGDEADAWMATATFGVEVSG